MVLKNQKISLNSLALTICFSPKTNQVEKIVRYNHELEIIEVFSSEKVGPEDLKYQLEKIVSFGDQMGVYDVLIDTTPGKKIPSPIELYQFMSVLPRNYAYAILAAMDQEFYHDLEFAENVSVNRGIRVQLFHDREKAMHWLKNGASNKIVQSF